MVIKFYAIWHCMVSTCKWKSAWGHLGINTKFVKLTAVSYMCVGPTTSEKNHYMNLNTVTI